MQLHNGLKLQRQCKVKIFKYSCVCAICILLHVFVEQNEPLIFSSQICFLLVVSETEVLMDPHSEANKSLNNERLKSMLRWAKILLGNMHKNIEDEKRLCGLFKTQTEK